MKTILSKLFSAQSKQPCIVVTGHDTELFSQLFSAMKIRNQPVHVFRLIHESSTGGLRVNEVQHNLTCISLNMSNSSDLKHFIQHIEKQNYAIELCVILPDFSTHSDVPDLSVPQVEQHWQNTALSAAAVSQAVIRQMRSAAGGTVIFLGGSHMAPSGHDLLSLSMFASIRALSQSLAREFQPKGIHVAYCMIEQWHGENQALMASVYHMCKHLHQQPSSSWSQELSIST